MRVHIEAGRSVWRLIETEKIIKIGYLRADITRSYRARNVQNMKRKTALTTVVALSSMPRKFVLDRIKLSISM
jgi:hypothetical protein